eukprot:scaffold7679_cov258-Pinguiococcus_pyrenoidosus.AAC.4
MATFRWNGGDAPVKYARKTKIFLRLFGDFFGRSAEVRSEIELRIEMDIETGGKAVEDVRAMA